MSINGGPDTVTNGLVFAYDMGNTKKSWKGKPTTNLNTNIGLIGMGNGVTISYVGMEDGWKKYSISGTWTGGTYPYVMHISSNSFTGGVTYSTSLRLKTNVQHKFSGTWSYVNYVNQPKNKNGTAFKKELEDGSIYFGRNNFEYTNTVSQPGYLDSRPKEDGTTFDSSTDFVWIREGQIEQGEFATPYVDGIRENSNSIVNMCGTAKAVINKLSYNVENEFSFDGTSDNLDIDIKENVGSQTFELVLNWSHIGECLSSGSGTAGGGLNGSTYFKIGTSETGIGVDLYSPQGYSGWKTGTKLSYDFQINKNYHIVVVNDNTEWYFYVNGEYLGVYDHGYLGNTVSTRLGVFRTHVQSVDSAGKCPIFRMYNRPLSAYDVKQNFDVIRKRFGL